MCDIAIIGAGPGGYVAAIRAAQLGAKVLLIEKDQVGGVCLNRGCIPTKALIASAHALSVAQGAEKFGLVRSGGSVSVDMQKVQARKNEIVAKLKAGVTGLLKSIGVELVNGAAQFITPKKISVDGKALDAEHVLIATGSKWIELADLKTDGDRIVTSDDALLWESVPERLLIVGGGVVGCEFACMMAAFGSRVTIVEATPSILPPVEKAISRLLARSMKSQGIEILTNTMWNPSMTADKILVAVGRRPSTAGLNLETVCIACDSRGFIKVDDHFKTTTDGIYAVGDVIGNPMLAHAASAEGIACVEGIFQGTGNGERGTGSMVCPSPIFTSPEIASVGATTEELEAKGIPFKTGRFPYMANGKAMCEGEKEGCVLVHVGEGGKILGAHIIGKDASILIAEASLAMKNSLTAEALVSTIHSHPTLSEALAEATEDALGKAIHKTRSIVR